MCNHLEDSLKHSCRLKQNDFESRIQVGAVTDAPHGTSQQWGKVSEKEHPQREPVEQVPQETHIETAWPFLA